MVEALPAGSKAASQTRRVTQRLWQKRRHRDVRVTSAVPKERHVRLVPGADIGLRDSFDKRVPQYKLRFRENLRVIKSQA
jgi:hypothetical protein